MNVLNVRNWWFSLSDMRMNLISLDLLVGHSKTCDDTTTHIRQHKLCFINKALTKAAGDYFSNYRQIIPKRISWMIWVVVLYCSQCSLKETTEKQQTMHVRFLCMYIYRRKCLICIRASRPDLNPWSCRWYVNEPAKPQDLTFLLALSLRLWKMRFGAFVQQLVSA